MTYSLLKYRIRYKVKIPNPNFPNRIGWEVSAWREADWHGGMSVEEMADTIENMHQIGDKICKACPAPKLPLSEAEDADPIPTRLGIPIELWCGDEYVGVIFLYPRSDYPGSFDYVEDFGERMLALMHEFEHHRY